MNTLKKKLMALIFVVSPLVVLAQSVSFEQLDLNGDGVISSSEGLSVLSAERFAEFDADADGKISKAEFSAKEK